MSKTGLAWHPACLKHEPYKTNPEVPSRVSATIAHLSETGLIKSLVELPVEPASDEDLCRVHAKELVDYVRDVSRTGYDDLSLVNTDVYVSPGTFEAATHAAGGAIAAAEAVWKGGVDNAFALVRPPGHHAARTLPAGFCFFNNMAVAIERLRRMHGVRKVAVFDWDAHCGHGTMGLFYGDPDVLTVSIHQDPSCFYPGTGFADQVGEGPGLGYCMNLPVPAGTGDPDYVHVLEDLVVPKFRKFKPDIIFVAAGQDGHTEDRISGLKLTDDGYAAMTAVMAETARELCGGKLALTLEGGYNIETTKRVNHRILSILAGLEDAPAVDGTPLATTKAVIDELKGRLAGTPMGD